LENQFDPVQYHLKSGLEIHYQILTQKKLFCRCPAGLYSQRHDAEVLRHMRPTLSELGEYDGTALMEFKTKKEIIYLLDRNSVCTYEMDDTPPFPINQEALDIAIEIALMLNCKIVGEVHVARKQYLDGSIPAGFQRTAIIGVDGWIPFQERKIHIIQLGLEEDACREVSDVRHTITFRTDRLSMPLVEVVTGPDMRTPEEVAQVGRIIGDLLRTTGKVRRGIGTVRQDVNVSIEGGRRVEIKGVPRIPLFPALVWNEAFRQHNLLKIRDFLLARFSSAKELQCEVFDLSEISKKIKHRLIQAAVKRGAVLKGVALRGVNGLLNLQTQPGLTFAHEISERIRVIACLDQLPNILHTEDLSVAGLEPADLSLVTRSMHLGKEDAGVLTWGPPDDAQTAAQEIILRVQEAFDGVPHETRQVSAAGRTDFERILPGPDRMYPDTDSPPTAISQERVERIRATLPPPPWEQQKAYEELGISSPLAQLISVHPKRKLFHDIMQHCKIAPRFAAWAVFELSQHLKRKGIPVENIAETRWIQLMDLVERKLIYRETLPAFVTFLAEHPHEDPEDFLAAQNLTPLDRRELRKEIESIAKRLKMIKLHKEENRPLVLMGTVMKELKGRAAGEEIWKLVQEIPRTK
jgi:glutamyl-tRNA(Gln) amidotransferase subunit E